MLKIDEFVAEMLKRRGAQIVHSIIEMGNHLGLGVTAEGVETQEQLDSQVYGCRYAQGYLFSKPLLAESTISSKNASTPNPKRRKTSPEVAQSRTTKS